MIMTNGFVLRGYVCHCKFGKVFHDFEMLTYHSCLRRRFVFGNKLPIFHPTTCYLNTLRLKESDTLKTESEGSISRHDVSVFSDIFS